MVRNREKGGDDEEEALMMTPVQLAADDGRDGKTHRTEIARIAGRDKRIRSVAGGDGEVGRVLALDRLYV